jgi:hypothetical protein
VEVLVKVHVLVDPDMGKTAKGRARRELRRYLDLALAYSRHL